MGTRLRITAKFRDSSSKVRRLPFLLGDYGNMPLPCLLFIILLTPHLKLRQFPRSKLLLLHSILSLPGMGIANPAIVEPKKFSHALRIDTSAGTKVEVFDTVQHAQQTYNLFRYCSDKHVGYGFGIGATAEGMRL